MHVMSCLPFVSARELAKCTGKIVSMMRVIGNLSRLLTRFLYAKIVSRDSWDWSMFIHPGNLCITKLRFWFNKIDGICARNLGHSSCVEVLRVFSDAMGLLAVLI